MTSRDLQTSRLGLISAGDAKDSVSGFNVSYPSLLLSFRQSSLLCWKRGGQGGQDADGVGGDAEFAGDEQMIRTYAASYSVEAHNALVHEINCDSDDDDDETTDALQEKKW